MKDHFEKFGYFVVRSAGSKGIADLVALRAGEVYLIQVKWGYSPLSPGEWSDLYNKATEVGVVAVHAFRNEKGRITMVKLLSARKPREKGATSEFVLSDQ